MDYTKHFQIKQTPQSQPVPGKVQVQNSAGGYVFAVDDWTRLDRFLILGTEGGTYYTKEKPLTIDNAQAIQRCIQVDGSRVVNRIVEISDAGRAPKNDPALFALAMCAGLGDNDTRRAALVALPKVARIGTHLFHFAQYVEGFRGWGRGLRQAIGAWYNDKSVDDLAFQAIKYQQRDGWSHRDLLRLAHPLTKDEVRNAVYKWVVKGEGEPTHLIAAFEAAKKVESKKEIVKLITGHNLPREAIPTQWLNEVEVWAALLSGMPLTALVRNLGKMSSIGLLKPMSEATGKVLAKLGDKDYIHKSRLHPLAILVALKTYQQGHGDKGSLSWSPVSQIVDALDEAFYMAFDNVDPTGKRLMLALDVSGSMAWGNIAGMPITPREGSAAMALVTARTEKQYMITAFSDRLVEVTISPRQRLDDVIATISRIPMGGTDCALPMVSALQKKLEIDGFCIYTDNETWFGATHPFQALKQYRQQMNPARLAVIGMTATQFSIADPGDAGMLDLIGFDTAAPAVISDFMKGT